MAQFDVYKNLNENNNKIIPYLIDVQHEIVGNLSTKVVIPLSTVEKENKFIAPAFVINNQNVILLTTQIAAISTNFIGTKVCSLEHKRDEILSSIDFLITGF